MAGDHRGVLVEAVQALPDRTLDRRRVAAPQVGAADATAEQGVAGDQQLRPGEPETHRARRMPRRVQCHSATAGQFLVVGQPAVRGRHRRVGHAEQLALHLQVVPEELVVLVQVQAGAGALLHLAGGEEVIQVRVGMDDADHLQAEAVEALQDHFVVAARIDDDGLPGQRIANDNPHVAALTPISACMTMWTEPTGTNGTHVAQSEKEKNRARLL